MADGGREPEGVSGGAAGSRRDSTEVIATFTDQEKAVQRFKKEIEKAYRGKFKTCVGVFDIDDTIIFDRKESTALNMGIIDLVTWMYEKGAHVYFVTARPDEEPTRSWTLDEVASIEALRSKMKEIQIFFCPPSDREREGGVAKFKLLARMRQGHKHGQNKVVSVGDQWSDLTRVRDDDDETELNRLTKGAPFAITLTQSPMKFKDSADLKRDKIPKVTTVTTLGLKLRSFY